MIVHNVGIETVEWLSDRGLLKGLWKSKECLRPDGVKRSYLDFCYEDWCRLTADTGDFYESRDIKEAMNGYDVEIECIEEGYPQEILEKL